MKPRSGCLNLLGFADAGLSFDLNTNLALTAGFYIPYFKGNFYGNGHILSDLYLDQPGQSMLGLFGHLVNGTLTDLGVSGSVKGFEEVGGLTGRSGQDVTINNTQSTVSVIGVNSVGGLVGRNWVGTIRNSYATGNVTGVNYVGGLVGVNFGTINNVYAIGSVAGELWVGGLVGDNSGTINNTYATGNVTGDNYVGGLVGVNDGTIKNTYAIGSVTGNDHVGGLAGFNWFYALITHSFWDIQTTGQSTSAGGVGLATAQMKTLANFNSATDANGNTNPGWDISAGTGGNTVWRLYEGQSYPVLRAFQQDLTVTANDAGKTYDGAAYSGGNGVTQSTTNALTGAISYGGSSQGATNPDRYVISPRVAMTPQDYQNWNVSYRDGVLTIDLVRPASVEIWLAGQTREPVSPSSSSQALPDSPTAAQAAGSGMPFLNLAPGFIRIEECSPTDTCSPVR